MAGGGEEARCAGAKGCGSLEEEDEWAWILGVGGLVLIGYGKSTPMVPELVIGIEKRPQTTKLDMHKLDMHSPLTIQNQSP